MVERTFTSAPTWRESPIQIISGVGADLQDFYCGKLVYKASPL